jgi:putative phosphonate metabolism protein
MPQYPRYAIYYAPAPGSELDRFGAHLLGYSAYTGEALPFPNAVTRAVPDWHELTQDPRRYGFHATLKAPFTLTPGKSEAALVAACGSFAATPRPVPVVDPIVSSISGFIAVIPRETSAMLLGLAADCVRAFDAFRAPLTTEDRARRNPSKLTERQRDHLDRWGYPYVMEDFQFHMTLTGRLAAERLQDILPLLQARFAGINLPTFAVDRIALFRQDKAESCFQTVKHFALTDATAKR